jgi:hypothetical protein
VTKDVFHTRLRLALSRNNESIPKFAKIQTWLESGQNHKLASRLYLAIQKSLMNDIHTSIIRQSYVNTGAH